MTAAANVRGRHSGRPVRLDPAAFDSGGGGRVFHVLNEPTLVAKLFATPCRVGDELGRRLDAVRRKNLTSPYLARLDDLLVDAADPDTLVGFTMTRVAGHTLYSVTNPDERRLLALPLAPLDRLTLATELARGFAALHAVHLRLGDAHHRNVMVTFDRRRVNSVVLLEPDTWLFEWRTGLRMERFTSMARADFLPPEFQRADLTTTPLTVESDRFALVLLVCLALFDCTPFAFAGSALTAEARIEKGYEWLTPTLPPGATPPDRLPLDPDAVPPAVMALLRDGLSPTPADRPAAATLAAALADWRQAVVEATAVGRFVAALTALRRARTLADLRRRTAEVFLAAFRRVCPRLAAKPPAWWGWLAVRGTAVAALVLGLAVWAGGSANPSPVPPDSPRLPTTAPLPPTPAAPREAWRALVEPGDPDPEESPW